MFSSGCFLVSDSEPGSDEAPGLLGALEHVSSEGSIPAVTYADGTQIRSLNRAEPQRYSDLRALSSPLLQVSLEESWAQKYGFDKAEIDHALTAQQPASAGHLRGSFDPDAITEKLRADGYQEREQDGAKVWVGAENQPAFQISDDRITYVLEGGNAKAVRPADGKSLADTPEYQRIAECLGDVYWVEITAREAGHTVSHIAIGQLARSATDTSGLICALTGSKASAEKAADAVRAAVARHAPAYEGTKVTVLGGDLPGVKVDVPERPRDRGPGKITRGQIDLQMVLQGL